MTLRSTRTPAARAAVTLLGLIAALAGCDGAPIDADIEPGALCGAAPITAEHLIEPGRYMIEVEAGNSALAGLCPVDDPVVRMGSDALFEFTAPQTGRYDFRKRGWATLVSVHAGCGRGLEPLACSPPPALLDRDLQVRARGVAYDLDAGETVLIQVDGFNPGRSPLGLTVFGPVSAGGACGGWVCDEDDFCTEALCAEGSECHLGVCAIPPPPGDVGAACDRLARCVDGLYCAEGACAVTPDPRLISGWAHVREGVLYGRLEIDDPARLTAASDLRIEGGEDGWHIDGDPQVFGVSRALDDMPDAIEVVDRQSGRVWFHIPVIDQPVKAADEPCTPRSEVDRCAEGSVCVGEQPRCAPVQVFAWANPRLPDRIAIELLGADLRGGEAVQAPGYADRVVADERRWVGRSDAVPGPVDVRYGGHLVARAVPVIESPLADVGERCDMALATSRCAVDADCFAGLCGSSTAPVIEEAIAVGEEAGVGLWIRGRDPEGNVQRFRLGRGEGRFAVEQRDPDVSPVWDEGEVWVDGDVFEAWFSGAAWFDVRALVVVIDDQGRESRPVAVERTGPGRRAEGALGDDCDPLGLLFPCAEGLVCDGEDGESERPTCSVVEPRCPEGLTRPIEPDAPIELDGAGATRQTRVSCFDPREGLAEQYFEFVPPAAGRYEIVAETPRTGGPFGLAVREGCRQRRTERACADEHYRVFVGVGGGHGAGARIEFEAEAGELLTVVLDGMPEGVITLRQL